MSKRNHAKPVAMPLEMYVQDFEKLPPGDALFYKSKKIVDAASVEQSINTALIGQNATIHRKGETVCVVKNILVAVDEPAEVQGAE